MDLRSLQHNTRNSNVLEAYNYAGIPIFSTYGIHEKVFESFLKDNFPKEAKILILGAGAGAFDRRLLDHGYMNITSTEFVPESYLVIGTNLIPQDLNKDFSGLGEFDAIIALEIIEHLENHFHFMRCVKACLNEEGVFYLSSPSVESTFSRAKFFMFGRLHFFSNEELLNTGHINPVFDHILAFNLEQNDLKIERHFTNANIWHRALLHKNYLHRAVYLVFFLLSRMTINKSDFDINLYKITHK